MKKATVGVLWVYQMSQRNWVTIKVYYRYLRKCLLGWHGSRLGFVTRMMERYLWAHLVGHHHNVHNVIKELITGWCVTKQVKRLAGNEIEQRYRDTDDRISGKYRTARQRELYTGLLESSTLWFIRWDHRVTCGSQHGYPDPAVGYWPENVSIMSACLPNP